MAGDDHQVRDETADIIANLAEVGIDTLLDEGLYRDIPVLSTIIGLGPGRSAFVRLMAAT
jgi:hypothetical protein